MTSKNSTVKRSALETHMYNGVDNKSVLKIAFRFKWKMCGIFPWQKVFRKIFSAIHCLTVAQYLHRAGAHLVFSENQMSYLWQFRF